MYEFKNDLYSNMLTRVMGIFDKNTAPGIPLKTRVEAADALAQAGDMRFAKPVENWITIPGCTFLMGAQADNPGKLNYDPDANKSEQPVHQVTLTAYKIAKYPVTVGESVSRMTTVAPAAAGLVRMREAFSLVFGWFSAVRFNGNPEIRPSGNFCGLSIVFV